MKKFELIWKIVFLVLMIASAVLFILDGNHLAVWVVNAVLWAFLLWQMFGILNEKLGKLLKDKEDENK